MAKKKTPKRKFVDWDSVEPLYRAGSLSLSQICNQYAADHINSQVWKKTLHHSAILKTAKQKKWTRNLAGKVQERIKEKLVTTAVTDCQLSEHEIIEKVSEAGTGVIMLHREEIKSIFEHEVILLAELKLVADKIDKDTVPDLKDLKLKTEILKNLTQIKAQRIALERQAHNINDDAPSDDKKVIRVSPMEIK